MNRPYAIGLLLKPKVLAAMLALYVSAFLSSNTLNGSHPFDLPSFLIGFVAVGSAVSGANAMNCYLDRDIDAVMARTRGRQVAMTVAGEGGVLGIGLALLTIASGISYSMGFIPFLLFVSGAGFYLLFYTFMLKRRTILNVISTVPSVAAPAWLGWFLGGAPLYPVGILLGLLVSVWGPLHLWSLAYVFAKDYSRAKVPMLPSVISRDGAIKSIIVSLLLMVASSYFLMPFTNSISYFIGVTAINVPLLYVGIRFWREHKNILGYWLFKLTAPYIVLVLSLFTCTQFF